MLLLSQLIRISEELSVLHNDKISFFTKYTHCAWWKTIFEYDHCLYPIRIRISTIRIDHSQMATSSNTKFYIWATSRQNQQNESAPSEDSVQPGYPLSLIRVFAVRSMDS